MTTPRTLSRAPRLPRVELSRQQERSEFSSCGGVPRSGEVVFLYIYQHYALSRPPRHFVPPPPPEGNFTKSLYHSVTYSLSIALYSLLSVTRTNLRDDHHCMAGPIFHLPIFSQHHDPTRPTHAHQSAPGIYRP